MIPLAVPNLTGNERKYLNECIDTTFVSSVGEFVTRIEKMGAEATDSQLAVATSSGTTALHTALVVSGVRPGDLVIVPSFTFIASANSIRHAGACPWFMDIDPKTWTIDPLQVRRELAAHAEVRLTGTYHKETGERISAIMPVYTLGNVADMDEISSIAEEYRLAVVADAACALGATYHGRGLGQLATLSCASMNGNKTVTAGGGGFVFGKDEALLAECKHLSTTARVWPDYDFDEVGYNYRMTNLQAAVGCAQLERLGEFVSRKREVHDRYEHAFSAIPGIDTFPVPSDSESSCWFSGIVCRGSSHEESGALVAALKDEGIEARTFWKPVHMQLPYAASLQASSLDVTDSLWSSVITLPCSTGITDDEIETVISVVRKTLGAS